MRRRYVGATGAIASDSGSTYTWDPSGTTLAGVGAAAGGSGVLAFTDSHGDVLGQFTAGGTAMAGSQAYDPWGNVTAATGSRAGLLGFQSAWTDPGTGKDLMGARWYSPAGGDFTSADTVQVPPVPDPAAASPFGYAADDPLDGTDPTGHMISIGSPETNSDYLAETTYANVYVGTVKRAVRCPELPGQSIQLDGLSGKLTSCGPR
jgi:RHS repeat-associated protein